MIEFANPSRFVKENKNIFFEALEIFVNQEEFILGNLVTKFEQEFAQAIGCNYAVGVNSGTDAITLALMSLGISKGDEVIVPALTAVATVAAICRSGAIPVLADVELPSYCVDVKAIESLINNRTKAIVVVHLYGNLANIEEISELAKDKNLFLIEDCAQACGASFNSRKAGTFGILGCFSFYPTKNLGALGDAGMIVTNSHFLYSKLLKLRQYGWNEHRVSEEISFVSRLDSLQAIFLSKSLPFLESKNQTRRKIALQYNEAFHGSDLILPEITDGNIFHLYVIQIIHGNRDSFLYELKKYGVNAGVHYRYPVHFNPAFTKFGHQNLSNSELICERIISLPLYPELSESEIEQVIKSTKKCLRS